MFAKAKKEVSSADNQNHLNLSYRACTKNICSLRQQ